MSRNKPVAFFHYLGLSAEEYLLSGLFWLPGLAGAVLALVSVGAFIVQLVDYLQTGDWAPFPVYALLIEYGPDSVGAWLVYPKSWLGFHHLLVPLLEFLSAWLVLFLIGLLMLGLTHTLNRRFRDSVRANRKQIWENELRSEPKPTRKGSMDTVDWKEPPDPFM